MPNDFTPDELAWFRRPLHWLALWMLLLVGCVHLPHLDPTPRSPLEAMSTAVVIDVYCGNGDAFSTDPADWVPGRRATGVAVSERHVVTAYHATSCPAIPVVHALLPSGRIVRLVVTDEDAEHDWSRLEMASADNFGLAVVPPVLAPSTRGTKACAVVMRDELWTLECGYQVSDTRMARMSTRAGDSGAPVYDMQGGLVGVVSAGDGNDTRIAPSSFDWLQGT
jgi:hypothetical protein